MAQKVEHGACSRTLNTHRAVFESFAEIEWTLQDSSATCKKPHKTEFHAPRIRIQVFTLTLVRELEESASL
jgi:hypothetical protein